MTVQPYGSWPSPITPEALLAGARTLAFPEVFEGQLYWMEGTPEEKGRSTVQSLSRAAGGLVPAPFNVRSRVHEYRGPGLCGGCGAGALRELPGPAPLRPAARWRRRRGPDPR